MRWKPTIHYLRLLFLVCCFANNSNSQITNTGELQAVVIDPSPTVSPGAGAEIRANAKASTQSAKTDREGGYLFFVVAHARCTLILTSDGFRIENRIAKLPLGLRGSVRSGRVCDEVPS
jgi:hypothetical protein